MLIIHIGHPGYYVPSHVRIIYYCHNIQFNIGEEEHAYMVLSNLVCYSSEANDVALRIAKEVTGGTEVIAVDQ